MTFLRLLLYPFSLIYGLATILRNYLYDKNILRQNLFDMPIISVGNLSVGGTGKTPQIEYLIRLLKDKYQVATLSRGYKRKSKGFQVGDLFSSSSQMGDEPMQFQHKFKDIVIAVDENRFHGINELCHRYPKLQIVLLDDAFQHRSVKPGLSILLTDYYHPYFDDYLLLAGNLRETKSGAQRADIIVVTKSPKVLSPFIRDSYKESLKPLPHQRLFFSYIRYGTIQPFDIEKAIVPKAKKVNTILLIAGIADTYPLEDHLKQLCFELITLQFSDHHQYTSKDIARITTMWNNIFTTNKLLLTTEKDAMRLKDPLIQELIVHLPLHYIPIEVEFHDRDKVLFDKQILEYAKKNRRDT